MAYDQVKYDEFQKRMEEKFPLMFSEPYGGFAIGEGWWPIVEKLCEAIQSRIDWKKKTRESLLERNEYDRPIPDEIAQVVVHQIKEKFGGLRFYYEGGDAYVRGLVDMAETWCDTVCEQCGERGTMRHGGWMRTLCDKHEEEYQQRMKQDGL